MSILIKGIEMPKDGCRDCILVTRKWHGDVCPILKREVTGNVERGGFQTDCPLVPVPPHGDLIDQHRLINIGNHLKLTVKDRSDLDAVAGVAALLYYVIMAPVIIPAEKGE